MAEVTIESLTKDVAAKDKRIDELTHELSETRSEARDRRLELREANKKLEDATATTAKVTTERDTLQKRIETDPNEWREKAVRLEGEIRSRDHRAAFDRLAKLANVDEANLDDLFVLSGYKPDGDVDDAKINTVIAEAVKTRPRMLKAADAAPTVPTGTPPAPRGAQPIATPPTTRGPGIGPSAVPQPKANTTEQLVQNRAAKSGVSYGQTRL